MKKLLFILALIGPLHSFGQLERVPKAWIDVTKRTDSIVNTLKNEGIDSIISYYRLRYHYDYFHPDNNTDDHMSAVLIWRKNDTVYLKKINQFYESQAELRNFQLVFDFYDFNKEEIDTTTLRLKPKSDGSIVSIAPVSTHARSYSLFFNIGKTERRIRWYDNDLEYHKDYPQAYLFSLSSKLYLWTKIIEEEIMYMDINERWLPLELKYLSAEEEKEMVKKWIERAEAEIKSLKEEFDLHEKLE